MQLDARLTFNKVRFDQDADAHLVLSLTAPTGKVEAKRPRLCIVPLIDLSGSMAGEKLTYAKKSLIKLIDHLTPNDYCGLITFSSTSEVEQKPIRCTAEAKDELRKKVGALTVKGSTNIGDALADGFKVANDMDLANEVITRVILFTDGAANHGPLKTPAEILPMVAPNRGIASVSAFGYGVDAEQDFLRDLSKSGAGNYSFVQNPDDALSAFGKELGGLLSTFGTNLVIEVSALAGHKVTRVVSDVAAEEEDTGNVVIKIPDILAEETRHLVLGLKLKAQKNAFPRDVNVVEVKLAYDTLDPNLKREHKMLEAKGKVQFVKAGEEQKVADPELDRIVGLAEIVRAQIEAEEHAKKGNYHDAQAAMDSVMYAVKTRGLVDLGAVAQNISARLGSQESYTSNSAYLTSFSRGATRGVGGTYDATATEHLRSAGVVMSNSMQSMVENSFTADDAVEISDSGVDLSQIGNQPSITIGGLGINTTGGHPGWLGGPVPNGVQIGGGSGWPSGGLTVNPVESQPFLMMPAVVPQPAAPAPRRPRAAGKGKTAKKQPKKRIAQKSTRW